ncbi:MAG: hypothetical protein PUP93_07900 [Rhizonema sp. NSF051]|nr:hypothetical protein [Rhizonema sp. NSF051]
MSCIYKRIVEMLDATQVLGYETDFKRQKLGLAKSQTLVRMIASPRVRRQGRSLRYNMVSSLPQNSSHTS